MLFIIPPMMNVVCIRPAPVNSDVQNLMSALGKAFPALNAEWYVDVMQLAFTENLTVLFARKGEA